MNEPEEPKKDEAKSEVKAIEHKKEKKDERKTHD